MQLNLKTFSHLIEDMAAALQGSASSLVDVSVGSVMRAIFEANASVVLWLQWLILQVLGMTRAATSVGSDLDSWMADFGVSRLPATTATGVVTFSRFAAGQMALVPVGSLAKTADGLISFAVTEDKSLSTWQQRSNGYVVPSGVSAADMPVACLTSGSIGNVLAGTIVTVASSLPGIDQVINASGFENGSDAEEDAAFRTRFQSHLTNRARATISAVRSAISAVRQGLGVLISENTNPDGTARRGSFLVVVDDGSGYPSADLLSAVATAVDLVRPVGTAFTVIPPIVLSINVSLTIFVSPGTASSECETTVRRQVTSYLNGLPIEGLASATRVAQSAYSAGAAILNVADVTLNGAPTDLSPLPRSVVKAGVITVVVDAG